MASVPEQNSTVSQAYTRTADLAMPDGGRFEEYVDINRNRVLVRYDAVGRMIRRLKYDRDSRLLCSEFIDEHGNRVIATRDHRGNETNTRYDSSGRVTDIQRRDKSGQIVFDEHIFADGSALYTYYNAKNQVVAVDEINRLGARTTHTEYDGKGREVVQVFYRGERFSETKTRYCDLSGARIQTHICENAYIDFVRITNADGTYKEYGYNRLEEQTYFEEGSNRGDWVRRYPRSIKTAIMSLTSSFKATLNAC